MLINNNNVNHDKTKLQTKKNYKILMFIVDCQMLMLWKQKQKNLFRMCRE